MRKFELKLLVSLCGSNRQSKSGLLEIDFKNNNITPILLTDPFNKLNVPLYKNGIKTKMQPSDLGEVTGITYYQNAFLAMFRMQPPLAIKFNSKCEILDAWLLNVPDIHSILCVGNELYTACTGKNMICKFELSKCIRLPCIENPFIESKYSSVWHTETENVLDDEVHLNSIQLYKNCFYISAFGKKERKLWNSANCGYIKNITTNSIAYNTYHPHSLCVGPDSLYFCESSHSNVCGINGNCMKLPNIGYARGLAFYKDLMVVGSSKGRTQSKSTGIIYNPADPGQISGSCSLYVFQLSDNFSKSKLIQHISLEEHSNEIFDILVI
jgi:hypothetical protein